MELLEENLVPPSSRGSSVLESITKPSHLFVPQYRSISYHFNKLPRKNPSQNYIDFFWGKKSRKFSWMNFKVVRFGPQMTGERWQSISMEMVFQWIHRDQNFPAKFGVGIVRNMARNTRRVLKAHQKTIHK